jgi:hypothetical protein
VKYEKPPKEDAVVKKVLAEHPELRKNAKQVLMLVKEEIKLPKDLINLFIFCVLDLKSKLLKINIELDDGSLKEVKSMAFVIKNVIYNQA